MFRAAAGALFVAAAGALLIGTVLGLWIANLNNLSSGYETAFLVGHIGLLYGMVNVLALAAGAVVLVVLRRPLVIRSWIGVLIAAYLVIGGLVRFITSVQFVSAVPHMSAIGVLDLTVVLSAAGLAGLGIIYRRTLSGVVTAVVLLVMLEGIHRVHEPTPLADLATLSALAEAGSKDSAASDDAPTSFASATRFESNRLFVYGVDGLSWEALIPLMERGELPNFRALLQGAAYGHLETLDYPRSPALWETIATGRTPKEHGVGDHEHFIFPGLADRIRHLPHAPLAGTVLGLNRLLVATQAVFPWSLHHSYGGDAKAARIWGIASRAGMRVGVYHWMQTTPATEVNGFIWGSGSFSPKTYPPEIWDTMPTPRRGLPATGMPWVEHELPIERDHFDNFLKLTAKFDPEFLAFYSHFYDAVNHLNWLAEAHDDKYFISGLSREVDPGPASTQTLQFFDEVLGEIVRGLPATATLVLISDHGFDYRGYEHDASPPGVFLARGPEVRPGLLTDASIYDIAPTLLQLLGLPVADDMTGHVLPIGRPGTPLAGAPQRVASHGPAVLQEEGAPASPDDIRQHREYLRALGYVD